MRKDDDNGNDVNVCFVNHAFHKLACFAFGAAATARDEVHAKDQRRSYIVPEN